MARTTTGNTRLKRARQAAGYSSQQDFAEAVVEAGASLGLRISLTERQVRRWESDTPPWPHPDQQRALTHLLRQDMPALGFTPPWEVGDEPQPEKADRRTIARAATAGIAVAAIPLPAAGPMGRQPASVAADFAAITASHRRLYWTVQPAQMHPTVTEHARLGTALLAEMVGAPRRVLATALAESYLMQGRIEFFDLRKPADAAEAYVKALQAAGEADEPLLGAAVIAHSAFVPGWAGDRSGMVERMQGARTMARRAEAPAELWAWLDCVEAECETRCGNPEGALALLENAETLLGSVGQKPLPAWLDWFSPVRLQAFKGNTELEAGKVDAARATLLAVLDQLPEDAGKQRTVVLGDLAACAAAAHNPQEACDWAEQALEQLTATWYETGMDRVREVRRQLREWDGDECVQRLDDRLYSWTATVSALQR